MDDQRAHEGNAGRFGEIVRTLAEVDPDLVAGGRRLESGTGVVCLIEPVTYSLEEAAAVAGVSENYVRRLVNDGEVPCIRNGSTRRLVREQWHEYLKQRAIDDQQELRGRGRL